MAALAVVARNDQQGFGRAPAERGGERRDGGFGDGGAIHGNEREALGGGRNGGKSGMERAELAAIRGWVQDELRGAADAGSDVLGVIAQDDDDRVGRAPHDADEAVEKSLAAIIQKSFRSAHTA